MTAEGERRETEVEVGGFVPLDQAFDSGSLYAVRSAVAAHAATAGLGRGEVYDVTAVAHELAANAVVHGAGRGRLRLWTASGFLYCQVSDDGKAGAADKRDPGDGAAPPDGASAVADGLPWPTEHGHGLWLAVQLAEGVGVAHGSVGTTATARFALAASGQV